MSVDAARASEYAPPARPRPRKRARERGVQKRRVAGLVAWIVLAAVLLTGIVALNVSVLRLNLQLDQLGSERAKLRSENAELQAQASLGAAPEAIRTAAAKAGYRPANPLSVRYVSIEPTDR